MKIKNVLYKIIFKSIILLEKVKVKIKPPVNNQKSEITKEGEFYFKALNNKRVFSPSLNCLNLIKSIFETEIYNFIPGTSTPLIIDCGANIGLGVLYWKMKFPDARVVAFEPSKKVFEALEKNVREFSLANVELINAAVSGKVGTMEFTYNEDVSGSLFLEKGLGQSYQVQTVRLDNYLKEKVDLLKVDIEGEEINIFSQIVENIDHIENLFIEYHSFVDRPQQLSVFLDQLEKNGFRYYIEGEYKNKAPLVINHVNLSQDLQVSIWAKRKS